MAGIGVRIKVFLETWGKRKAGEIPDPEEASCAVCGVLLKDRDFVLVDGDLLCPKCKGEHGTAPLTLSNPGAQ